MGFATLLKQNALEQSSVKREVGPSLAHSTPLTQWQRAIGNQALQSVYRVPVIQAKLTISQPGDPYEQEADRIADQVMRMPDREVSSLSHNPETIQRTCAACASGQKPCPKCSVDDELQRKSLSSTITPLIQRKNEELEEFPRGIQTVTDVVRGGGQPLPESARAFFEPRFGHDFSGVRVHTGAAASASANSLNARAYTLEQDIVFGSGQFEPETDNGKRLLAHELTHVIQQNAQGRQSAANQMEIQRRSFLFGAGGVRFNGCSETDLSDFAVIPEEGTETFRPINGVSLETDGFWWRHHQPRTEWFKISDDCDIDITCTEDGFSRTEDCTIKTPGWTSDPHGSTNPF